MSAVRWLSIHVAYACRHSGACCSSGWAIPMESAGVAAIDRAIGEGRMVPLLDPWLNPAPDAPPDIAGVLRTTSDGPCVFHREGCAIHHVLGHAAMPSACQHFPRVCLLDPRGTTVTLSHYCPTATSLLFEEQGELGIVAGPPPLPPGGEPEGLDAREALPPLLTPGVLMDVESYGAWETHMVRVLGRDEWPAEDFAGAAVDRLYGDASILSKWRPGRGSLLDAVRALDDDRVASDAVVDKWTDADLFTAACAAVAAPHQWPAAPPGAIDPAECVVAPWWPAHAAVVSRYLAAHAFGSWMAYQGNGLCSVVRAVHTALVVLRVEATRACAVARAPLDAELLHSSIRQADLLLRHLVDPQDLAKRLSEIDYGLDRTSQGLRP